MDTLLHVGLCNAVLATLLAVLAAVVSRLCRRPALVRALWLLVLLKLVTPPLVALPISWPREPSRDREGAVLATPLPESRGTEETTPLFVVFSAPAESSSAPINQSGDREGTILATSLPHGRGSEEKETEFAWKPTLLTFWLAGTVSWWTIAGMRVRRFLRGLRHARVASEPLQEQTRRLAERLGLTRCPSVYLIAAPVSPLLWSFTTAPRLLFPSALWERLDDEQRDTLLVHELAHLRRRDHWIRRLEFVVLGLYWWFPVAWWARRRLQEAEEQCCDA